MKLINLHTDGACSGNPGPGGWACILEYNGVEKVLSGKSEDITTNNRMEILSVLKGLEAIKKPCEVVVYSDSRYVVMTINEWLEKWLKTSLRGKANIDLWETYIQFSKIHKITAVWVKAHNGDLYNERCNELAQNESKGIKCME